MKNRFNNQAELESYCRQFNNQVSVVFRDSDAFDVSHPVYGSLWNGQKHGDQFLLVETKLEALILAVKASLGE